MHLNNNSSKIKSKTQAPSNNSGNYNFKHMKMDFFGDNICSCKIYNNQLK